MSDPRKGCPHDFYARAEMKCLDCLAVERDEAYRLGIEDAARWIEASMYQGWHPRVVADAIRALSAPREPTRPPPRRSPEAEPCSATPPRCRTRS